MQTLTIGEDMTYYLFDTFTQVNNILSVQKIAIKLGKHKQKIRKKDEKTTSKGKKANKKNEKLTYTY